MTFPLAVCGQTLVVAALLFYAMTGVVAGDVRTCHERKDADVHVMPSTEDGPKQQQGARIDTTGTPHRGRPCIDRTLKGLGWSRNALQSSA